MKDRVYVVLSMKRRKEHTKQERYTAVQKKEDSKKEYLWEGEEKQKPARKCLFAVYNARECLIGEHRWRPWKPNKDEVCAMKIVFFAGENGQI